MLYVLLPPPTYPPTHISPQAPSCIGAALTQLLPAAPQPRPTHTPIHQIHAHRLATRAIRLVPVSLLERNTRRFIEHLQESLQRWEACPGSRRDIEHLIAARMADRVRGVRSGQL